MEGLAETIENVGLAQEIQKGLAPSLQKKPDWAGLQPKTDGFKEKFGAGTGWACFQTELGMYCITEWANTQGIDISMGRRKSSLSGNEQKTPPTEAGVEANWEGFKTSPAFDVMCKYMALADEVAAQTPNQKLFEEVRPLGRGAFGAVWLAFKKDTGAPFATKKMVKCIAKQNKMLKDVLIEREVLAKIRSPFCVNLHYSFQDADNIALVLSLMPGGDLAFLLQTRYSETKKKEDRVFTPLSAQTLKFYAASMACGLQAIHEAGYVYRDLKPQNVLLDAEGQVRISDMGLTADITKGPIKQCSGTRGYWSPETIKKEKYTTAPDWWSLGVTVYVLTSDKMPFKGKTDEEKDAATLSGEIEYSHGESDEIQKVRVHAPSLTPFFYPTLVRLRAAPRHHQACRRGATVVVVLWPPPPTGLPAPPPPLCLPCLRPSPPPPAPFLVFAVCERAVHHRPRGAAGLQGRPRRRQGAPLFQRLRLRRPRGRQDGGRG